jgi:pSer/pThr/pTyr-binding forkhead associated (FHA) protein
VIQLRVINRETQRLDVIARRFPFTVGRSPENNLQLELPGVQQKHFTINLNPASSFEIAANDKNYLLSINDAPVISATLKNGDLIGIGALKVRFNLSPASQSTYKIREAVFWMAFAGLFIVQLILMSRLQHLL